MAHVAYIRVSTVDQKTERQLDGCKIEFEKVFEEKRSAKDRNRPKLQECLEYLREGDTLHVHSIDRFARSLKNLQEMVEELTGRGVTVQFHSEHLTFSPNGSSPMNELLFQIMGAFAEFERKIMLERQREGIAKAKESGKYSHGKGGRKKTIDRERVKELREQGLPFRKIADEMGCSLSSVQRALGLYEK